MVGILVLVKVNPERIYWYINGTGILILHILVHQWHWYSSTAWYWYISGTGILVLHI